MPTIPINNSTITETTTVTDLPTGGLPMNFIIGGGLLVLLFFIVLFLVLSDRAKDKTRLNKARQFNFTDFCKHNQLVRLAKYNRMALVIVLGSLFGIFLPPVASAGFRDVTIRSAIAGIGWTLSGVLIVAVVILNMYSEVKANSNATYAYVDVYDLNGEVYPQLWRRLTKGAEVLIDANTANETIGQILDNKVKNGQLTKERAEVIKTYYTKLETKHIYRAKIEETYDILLVLPGLWETVLDERKLQVFADTTNITVGRTRLDVLYMGEETRTVTDVEKGRETLRDLAAGFFTVLTSPSTVQSIIKEGKFTATTNADAQAAVVKHHLQQNAVTGQTYERRLGQLVKTEADLRKERYKSAVNGATEAQVYIRGFHRLFTIDQPQDQAFRLIGYGIAFFFVYYVIFTIIGWM